MCRLYFSYESAVICERQGGMHVQASDTYESHTSMKGRGGGMHVQAGQRGHRQARFFH